MKNKHVALSLSLFIDLNVLQITTLSGMRADSVLSRSVGDYQECFPQDLHRGYIQIATIRHAATMMCAPFCIQSLL